jgi:hypothetical protein
MSDSPSLRDQCHCTRDDRTLTTSSESDCPVHGIEERDQSDEEPYDFARALDDEYLDAAARREECDYADHEWADAGGGLLICMNCQEEKWA